MKQYNKRIMLIVAVTAIAGEVFVDGIGTPFRFTIGTAIFLYAILSLPDLLIIPTGALVAFFTFVIRVLLDFFIRLPYESFAFIIADRFPGAIYFIVLALALKYGRIKKFVGRPFSVSLILLMFFALLISYMFELLFRDGFAPLFSVYNILTLLLVAGVQVFLVIAFVNISHFKQLEVLDEQEQMRYEKRLILVSNLYDEFFFMQKKTENTEKVMAKSYDLYKQIKRLNISKNLQQLALEIAEEVHEIKKDSVRILAGLSKVFDARRGKQMHLSEIFELVIKTNRNYSQSFNKNIQFHLAVNVDLNVSRVYPLIAILNNIVSNAVEAIKAEGNVTICAGEDGEMLLISVCDDGEPIDEEDRELIFKAGYTTKFDDDGVPSTGIGLAYVKGLVEDLRGEVWLETGAHEKCFHILLPPDSLREGGKR